MKKFIDQFNKPMALIGHRGLVVSNCLHLILYNDLSTLRYLFYCIILLFLLRLGKELEISLELHCFTKGYKGYKQYIFFNLYKIQSAMSLRGWWLPVTRLDHVSVFIPVPLICRLKTLTEVLKHFLETSLFDFISLLPSPLARLWWSRPVWAGLRWPQGGRRGWTGSSRGSTDGVENMIM